MTDKIQEPEKYLESKGISAGHPDFELIKGRVLYYNELIDDMNSLQVGFSGIDVYNRAKLLAARYGYDLGSINSASIAQKVPGLKAHIRTLTGPNLQMILDLVNKAQSNKVPISGNTIFWSWQSHFSESKRDIERALDYALKVINSNKLLAHDLVKETAFRPDDGYQNIDELIITKIKKSRYFIADVTPVLVWEDDKKFRRVYYPNPNVLVEVGYATQALKANQVALISADRRQEPGYAYGSFPFDFQNRPIIQYDVKSRDDLKDEILLVLLTSLVNNKELSQEKREIIWSSRKMKGS